MNQFIGTFFVIAAIVFGKDYLAVNDLHWWSILRAFLCWVLIWVAIDIKQSLDRK